MNTMNQPSKIPPEVNPALVVHNEVTNTYVIPQPLSETDGPALVVPIRQSLAPRKSTRPLHTSAVEDAENLPFTVAAGPSLFQIFKDQSGGSGLQSSSKKDVEVDNAEEEDSENTPPLHSPQVRARIHGVSHLDEKRVASCVLWRPLDKVLQWPDQKRSSLTSVL